MLMYTQVATKAYIKVRDMRMIDLINRIRASRRLPGHSDQVCKAGCKALSQGLKLLVYETLSRRLPGHSDQVCKAAYTSS